MSLAQSDSKSVHEIEYYQHLSKPADPKRESLKENITHTGDKLPIKCFGWHPYWASSGDYLNYDYSVLSTIGYFSYNVDPQNGFYTDIHGWDETPIIQYAHSQGVKVVMVITNFGYDNNDMLLSDTQSTNRLIDRSVFLVKKHGGDGINIDFESIRSSQRENLTNFMQNLSNKLKAELPDAELSICLPSVHWTNAFDIRSLSKICDYMIIMGYDYFWSGSENAGPIAPLENRAYCVRNSIIYNLENGATKDKLYLGVPWYGYDWQVESSEKMSKTLSSGVARIYPSMEKLSESHGKQFDIDYKSSWIAYNDNGWRQAWFDDSLSLSYKYGIIDEYDLEGIGIWAISYQDKNGKVWKSIKDFFTASFVFRNESNEISIYPNPCFDLINILIPDHLFSNVDIKIFNLNGELQFVKSYFSKDVIKINLLTKGIPSGVYLIAIESGNNKYLETIIKI